MDAAALLYANKVRTEAAAAVYAMSPPGTVSDDEFSKALDAAIDQVVKADSVVADQIRKILGE